MPSSGVQVASQATGNPDVNGSIWSVGDRDSNDNPFKGRIWNVQFYTRALKPNEVEMLFLNPTAAVNPPRPDPPVPGGGGTPPPPPTAAASGALIYGRPATPVPHRNIIISNHSGQKPLLQ